MPGSARPSGSQSGSRTTSAPTHSPKTSTSPRWPTCASVRRQVGVGDAALHRVAVAAGGDAPDDLAVDPHRLVAQRHRARVVEHQAGQPPVPGLGLRARSASRPMKSAALSSRTAKPRPASYGVSSGVMSRDPGAVALLQPQAVDGPIAAGQHALRRAGRPERCPTGRGRTRSGRRAPSRARRRR